jgi:anti-anti-sigma factor
VTFRDRAHDIVMAPAPGCQRPSTQRSRRVSVSFRDATGEDGGVTFSEPPWGSDSLEPADAQVLTVTVERDGRSTVLVVTGELDMQTTSQLSSALTQALRDRPGLLVVDLSAVEFLGSAGLTSLLDAHESAGEHTDLRLVATSRVTLRPLQITGLDQRLAVFPSREEALAR